ncbi:MAG: TonB-dependent receptor [Bryobacteraceae bacterium]
MTCHALALTLFSVTLTAQVNSGSLLGDVRDTSGALLPSTTIAIKSGATGRELTVLSDTEGHYSISSLPPGLYSLTATKTGFQSSVRDGIDLHLDQRLRVDLELSIAGTPITITVSPDVQTETASLGKVIVAREIRDLPLLSRNFQELLLLVPGVAPGAGGNMTNYAVNGQREFANSIVINGLEVTGNRNNDSNLRPSVDAVEEFKAITSSYSAEFGRSGAGVVTIQTRSGSNVFHGAAFEFLRTNKTTAKRFFAPEPSQLKENSFGATLGGPLRPDKTFFFAAYEGKRTRDTFSYLTSTVPTWAGPDFSKSRDPYTGQAIPIFDPQFYAANFYAQQFPGNVIPVSRISLAGLKTLQTLFPKPNTTGILNGWFNNYQVLQRYRFNSDTGDLRLDHYFSSKQRVSLTYDVTDFRSLTGDPFEGKIPVAGGGGADSGDRTTSGNHSVGGSYVYTVSPTQLNELRVGFLRATVTQDSLVGATQIPQTQLAFGATTGGSTYKPLTFKDDNFSLADHYSWIFGRHTMKFGYETRRLAAQPNFSLFPTGYHYYYGAYSSLTSDPNYSYFDANAYYGNGGNEIADLLLGLPGYIAQGKQFQPVKTRSFEHHAFVQDSWRVAPRLTVELGLRYEFQAPYRETDGFQSNVDYTALRMLLGNAATPRADKNNFAPRVGLAWRAQDKTTIRAGYGIFYTPENSARSDVLTKNYPYFSQQIFLNSPYAEPVFQLDRGIPFPTPPAIPSGASSIGVGPKDQTLYFVDPNFRTGYSQSYNVTVQRELPRKMVFEASYVGALSHKLALTTANQNLGERISKQLGIIRGIFSQGNSAYHGLQVNASRRFDRVGFLLAYRLSKAMDNGPAPFNLGKNRQSPQDAFDLSNERAVSSIDLRHNLTASSMVQLPWGFQLNAIVTLRSGLPANVIRNGSKVGYEGLRPNVARDPNIDAQTLTRYFDTAAFSDKNLGATQPGNAGRNIVRGPGFANVDASVFKNFLIRERFTLNLRLEAFNATNTPHFANPNTDLSQGQFGSITQTVGNSRILQLAAKVLF